MFSNGFTPVHARPGALPPPYAEVRDRSREEVVSAVPAATALFPTQSMTLNPTSFDGRRSFAMPFDALLTFGMLSNLILTSFLLGFLLTYSSEILAAHCSVTSSAELTAFCSRLTYADGRSYFGVAFIGLYGLFVGYGVLALSALSFILLLCFFDAAQHLFLGPNTAKLALVFLMAYAIVPVQSMLLSEPHPTSSRSHAGDNSTLFDLFSYLAFAGLAAAITSFLVRDCLRCFSDYCEVTSVFPLSIQLCSQDSNHLNAGPAMNGSYCLISINELFQSILTFLMFFDIELMFLYVPPPSGRYNSLFSVMRRQVFDTHVSSSLINFVYRMPVRVFFIVFRFIFRIRGLAQSTPLVFASQLSVARGFSSNSSALQRFNRGARSPSLSDPLDPLSDPEADSLQADVAAFSRQIDEAEVHGISASFVPRANDADEKSGGFELEFSVPFVNPQPIDFQYRISQIDDALDFSDDLDNALHGTTPVVLDQLMSICFLISIFFHSARAFVYRIIRCGHIRGTSVTPSPYVGTGLFPFPSLRFSWLAVMLTLFCVGGTTTGGFILPFPKYATSNAHRCEHLTKSMETAFITLSTQVAGAPNVINPITGETLPARYTSEFLAALDRQQEPSFVDATVNCTGFLMSRYYEECFNTDFQSLHCGTRPTVFDRSWHLGAYDLRFPINWFKFWTYSGLSYFVDASPIACDGLVHPTNSVYAAARLLYRIPAEFFHSIQATQKWFLPPPVVEPDHTAFENIENTVVTALSEFISGLGYVFSAFASILPSFSQDSWLYLPYLSVLLLPLGGLMYYQQRRYSSALLILFLCPALTFDTSTFLVSGSAFLLSFFIGIIFAFVVYLAPDGSLISLCYSLFSVFYRIFVLLCSSGTLLSVLLPLLVYLPYFLNVIPLPKPPNSPMGVLIHCILIYGHLLAHTLTSFGSGYIVAILVSYCTLELLTLPGRFFGVTMLNIVALYFIGGADVLASVLNHYFASIGSAYAMQPAMRFWLHFSATLIILTAVELLFFGRGKAERILHFLYGPSDCYRLPSSYLRRFLIRAARQRLVLAFIAPSVVGKSELAAQFSSSTEFAVFEPDLAWTYASGSANLARTNALQLRMSDEMAYRKIWQPLLYKALRQFMSNPDHTGKSLLLLFHNPSDMLYCLGGWGYFAGTYNIPNRVAAERIGKRGTGGAGVHAWTMDSSYIASLAQCTFQDAIDAISSPDGRLAIRPSITRRGLVYSYCSVSEHPSDGTKVIARNIATNRIFHAPRNQVIRSHQRYYVHDPKSITYDLSTAVSAAAEQGQDSAEVQEFLSVLSDTDPEVHSKFLALLKDSKPIKTAAPTFAATSAPDVGISIVPQLAAVPIAIRQPGFIERQLAKQDFTASVDIRVASGVHPGELTVSHLPPGVTDVEVASAVTALVGTFVAKRKRKDRMHFLFDKEETASSLIAFQPALRAHPGFENVVVARPSAELFAPEVAQMLVQSHN